MSELDQVLDAYPPPKRRCCVCQGDPEMLELIEEFVRRRKEGDPKLRGWCIAGAGERTRSLYKVLQDRYQFDKSRISLERHADLCCGRS